MESGTPDFEASLVTLEQRDRIIGNFDREQRHTRIGVLTQHTALTFRCREIGEADAKRDHATNVEFIDSKTVAEKLGSEMTPAIGEKFVELGRRDRVGVKLFVDETDITVEMHRGSFSEITETALSERSYLPATCRSE